MAIRTFLALDLDDAVRRAIAAAAESVPVGASKIRWVEPHNLHITLKFLGDVPDENVMAVCQTVRDVAAGLEPTTFDVAGLTTVPPRGRVKMIWADVRDPDKRITRIFDELEAALEVLGFDIEPRAYRPHVTVARVRHCPNPAALRQAVGKHAQVELGTQEADEVVVYSSELTREGPIYRAMSRCKFGLYR